MTRKTASSLVLTSVLGVLLAAAVFGFVVTQANAASNDGKDKDGSGQLDPFTLQLLSQPSGNGPVAGPAQAVQLPSRPETRSPYRPPLF